MKTENPTNQVYEIINPSDPYTIKGPFLPCAVAVAVLGDGKYGIEGTPVLFGWDEWFTAQGIGDLTSYIDDHKAEIAAVLDTVLIGKAQDREEVEATLELLPAEQRDGWLAMRHDKRRSSLNNIGRAAMEWASVLRSRNSTKQND